MKIRFILCLAAAAGIAAFTGAMEGCETLSNCAAAQDDPHLLITAPAGTDDFDITPEEALATDVILTAMIRG